jgi:hypothetical protein
LQRDDTVNANEPRSLPAADSGDGLRAGGSRQPGPSGARSRDRGQRGRPWLYGAWIGLLLFGGCSSLAFATTALWELGAVINGLAEVARSTSASSMAAPPPSLKMDSEARAPQSTVPEPGEAPEPRADTTSASLDAAGLQADRAASQPVQAPEEASEKIVPLALDPEPAYVRTECSDVFVYIVSVADAPMASAASLAVGKSARARFRRPGQSIGDWEVLAISDDWSGTNPGVWLLDGNAVCRAELAGNPTRVHVPLKQARKPRAKRRRRRAR